MIFHLEIEMDGAAFENPDELPIIVRKISRTLVGTETSRPQAGHSGLATDNNGNTVARWWIDRSNEPLPRAVPVVTSTPLAKPNPGKVLGMLGLHKATPPVIADSLRGLTCIHCHKGIHRVLGGQGPTWVHSDGYVTARNVEGGMAELQEAVPEYDEPPLCAKHNNSHYVGGCPDES